jgi:N-acyl-D-aspartate/D-glutamate deacylase
LSASILRLDRSQRGMLRAGWAADVIVFDPEKIEDRASYQHPARMAAGMEWVLVNGRAIIDGGRFHASRRAGRLLLRTDAR